MFPNLLACLFVAILLELTIEDLSTDLSTVSWTCLLKLENVLASAGLGGDLELGLSVDSFREVSLICVLTLRSSEVPSILLDRCLTGLT